MTYRRKSPEVFIDELKSVLSANTAGNIELAGRLNALVKEAALALQPSRQRPPPDSSELLSRVLDFQLTAYAVVTEHSLAILNGLITSAERTLLDEAEPAPAPDRPTSRQEDVQDPSLTVPRPGEASRAMQLSGRRNETLTCPFLVENQYDRGLEVAFEAEPLVPRNGPPLPARLISFEPATLVLPPHGQAVANAHIKLTSDFTVGETYSTALHVLGFQCPPVHVAITVLAPKKAERQRAAPHGPEETPQPEPVRRPRPPRMRRTSSATTTPA
jgi:hypothetical protein